MFKVLIVDDEAYIRKGLVNIVNWKAFDCSVTHEASDGVEGLAILRDHPLDIAFVDINMPEINGLEMIRQGKAFAPNCKFVILTGYRDFSYLQEAIKLGAFDYILKPSKIEEIAEILKRATMELRHEQEQAQEQQKLKEMFERSIPILKEKLLKDLMDGHQFSPLELKENLELYGLRLYEYVVMFVSLDEDFVAQDQVYQKQLYQFGIINMVQDIYGDLFIVETVSQNNDTVAFVIQPKEDRAVGMDKIEQFAENVLQLISRCFDFTVTIAMSHVGYKVEELRERAKECEDGMAYRFYMGPSSIILYKDFKSFFKGQDQRVLEEYERKLISHIQTGDEDGVVRLLEQLKQEVLRFNALPEQIKHYYWTLMYNIGHIRLSIKALEHQGDEGNFDMMSLYGLIDGSNNILEVHELLETVAINIVKRINQYNIKNINIILQQAMAYINKNYSSSLTLQELADETYVSTYYLSRMFTKELGKNFIDYLNEIRIDAAKKLLKDPQLKTYEVSEQVGIKDAHYFSKLFKKYAGVTPTDYRNL
jgi:two-component system, response regulator YesN